MGRSGRRPCRSTSRHPELHHDAARFARPGPRPPRALEESPRRLVDPHSEASARAPGARTHHRRGRRRSERDCDLLPGGCAVRAQHALDDAPRLPADVGHPGDVRHDRPHHGPGARREHQDRLSALRAEGRGARAPRRQHLQHCRRRLGHGRGRRARHRLRPPRDDRVLRGAHARAANLRPVPAIRVLLEVADALAPRLRRGALRGARAVGRGGAAHRLAEVHVRFDRGRSHRRRVRHDDQPVPVLLAGLRGSRGPRRAGRRAAGARSRGGPARAKPHPMGHLERHVLLGSRGLLHHSRDRRDLASRRHHAHRDRRTGRECAAAAGGRRRVPAVCAGRRRGGALGRAGARRVGRLRVRRGDGMELRSRAQGARCARLLRRHRLERARRPPHPVFADRSDEGFVPERGHQRGGRRPAHGRGHPARIEAIRDGALHGEPAPRHPRLDRDRRDGRGGCADARARARTPGLGAPGLGARGSAPPG